MKEAIRCFIACILPCGALDVIRIVHASGHVEEISGTVSAGEIMRAYPKHVLRKPPSSSSDGPPMAATAAVVLPPHAELQKGKIYFLIPVATSPAPPEKSRSGTTGPRRRRKKRDQADGNLTAAAAAVAAAAADKTRLLLSERYLSEILSEKASTQRERRPGRVTVWRPHLESISEVSNDL